MNKEELRKRNLAVINRATKLAMFTLARAVRTDGAVFGPTEMTVDNPEFNKLIESMILDKIKHQTRPMKQTNRMELL